MLAKKKQCEKYVSIIYSRRLMEEDDGVLSEIEPDSVPNEVRDWLAMTFTRSMSTIKRRPSDKPKFKSVAQAIRAGIMVDRFVINVIYSCL
jgi:calcium/calmodulin-dependent 3',5'-cyclic nucleotide phosphodiesterase